MNDVLHTSGRPMTSDQEGRNTSPDNLLAGLSPAGWVAGTAPVAVVMISLNEAHNMEGVFQNLKGWAQEVFLVDSHSRDDTVDIALRHGVHVVQRRFRGFGDQWNFALNTLPIAAPWTMKLDPDERLSDELKEAIIRAAHAGHATGLRTFLRLWFMGRPLPTGLDFVRVWRTGSCRFTEVSVNEHPIVDGPVVKVTGELEHHDSPHLHHWLDKQNRYTTAEAVAAYKGNPLADHPRLFGSTLQRRMWIKRYFYGVPFRYLLLFLYHYIVLGGYRVGWVGYAWSRLRSDVYRLTEYKLREVRVTGRIPGPTLSEFGSPHPRVSQYD